MERIVLLLLNLFVSSTSGSLISQFFNDVAPESETLISFGKNDHPNLWVQTPTILLSTFDIDPCLLQKVRDTIVTSATLIGYVKNNEDIKQLQKVQKYLQISRSYIINLQSGLVDANIFSEHETWIINLQSDKSKTKPVKSFINTSFIHFFLVFRRGGCSILSKPSVGKYENNMEPNHWVPDSFFALSSMVRWTHH